jgi:hypothetical protein
MAKSRFYSLIENQQHDPNKADIEKLVEQDFYLNVEN